MQQGGVTLTSRSVGAHAIITAVGELDLSTTPQLRACLSDAIGNGSRALVIDLTGVDFLDSATIGVLIGAWNRLGSHPEAITLVSPESHVLRVLKMAAIDQVFSIRSSLPEFAKIVAEPELAP